jgi:hypothetical protein
MADVWDQFPDAPAQGPAGLRTPGNIDLHNRPIRRNPDGSFSTVKTIGIGTDAGEVVIPTISDDGRQMSEQEAIAQYRQTGKSFGVFDTPQNAATFAQSLHEQQAQEYGGQGGAQSASDPWAQFPDAEPAEAPSGVGNAIKNTYGAIYEPLMQTGSSMLAAPIAGLAGLGARGLEAAGVLPQNAGADTVESVQRAMTYEPRTAGGKRVSQIVQYPMEKYARFADRAGDVVNAPETGGPRISGAAANYGLDPVRQPETGADGERAAAATIVNTAIQAAPAIFLKGRGKSAGVADNVSRSPPVGRAAGVASAETPAAPAAATGRPAGLGTVLRDAPTKEALKKASTAAYKRAEDAGAIISRESFTKAQETIGAMLEKEGIDPTLHPSTTAALKRIQAESGPITLEKLETLRRIAKDAEASLSPADKRLAAKTVETIDRYADTLGAKDLNAGSTEAVAALKEARGLYSRARKADTLDELMERAEISAPNFSASGMENAIRTEFRALAKNSRRMRMFTAEERAAIKKVAMGGPVENALRMLGKFAPTGVVSTALSTGAGFMAGGPVGAAALPAIGGAARYGAAKMTMRNAARANELVRRGPNALATAAPRNALRTEPVQ